MKRITQKFIGLIFIGLLSFTNTFAQKKEVGNLVLDNVSDISPGITASLEQYLNVRTASFVSWDKEGKGMFISTRFGEVAQIHYVAQANGDRQQITFFKEPLGNALVCPDKSKNGFIFLKDVGGNENYQINYFDLDTRKSTMLSDGKSRNLNAVWDNDGKNFAFSSNKRNGADLDFYLASIDNPSQEKMIFQGKGGGWSMNDWSVDKKQMLVAEYISVNESRVYVLTVDTGLIEQINANPKKQIAYGDVRFSKDGKGVYFTSDEDTEFMTLRYYDFATKKTKNITVKIVWDIENYSISPDGKKLIFSSNEGGYSNLYLLNTTTNEYATITTSKKGVINNVRFNPLNNKVAITMSSYDTPSDVFVLDLDNGNQSFERWTMSETGGLDVKNFVEPQLIDYPTFDKVSGEFRKIPAFQYMPKGVNPALPVLIYIHGGPEGQSLPNFSSLIQFFVNELGIAVLVPNVRGSTGYGKTFLKLDNAELRENSVKDIGALLDWIQTQDNYLDSDKVAVYGGSYGGYMSLACMTNYNERFKCGVDLFGISNFVTFLKNTSPYRQDLRRVEYGDERDPKMSEILTKISPMTNIKNITKPMFIFQGKNDPRVPLSESEQMVEQLKKQGNTVWYIMAKDEGHGITKKTNREYIYASFALFLQNYLVR